MTMAQTADRLKVSFDLDGTAWKYRRFFRLLAHALKDAGHEVGILTAHDPRLFTEDERLWLGRGFPQPDFFYNHGDMRAAFPSLEGLRALKIAFAESVGIDCHIDDWDDLLPGQIELVLLGQADESRR